MFSFQSVPHYSYKCLRLASYLLLGATLCTKALAAGEYSVENVTVDASGSDTTEARSKALAAGEVDAFKQLVTKQAPQQAADIIKKTPPSQISILVRGYEVIDEKMSPDHYHATLRYNFDPRQMQALLAPPAPVAPAPGATHAATPASPGVTPATVELPANLRSSKAVLVLPVLNDPSGVKLWQDDNKWRTAWYDAALESGGGLIVAPLGNFDDRVDVDDSNVQNASAVSLHRMNERYGVGEIYVLSAFYNQKADPKPTLEVTLRRLVLGKPDTITHANYTIHSTETLDTLMVRASNDIAKTIYKQQTLDPNKIEFERLKDINARVNTTDMREWEALRKRLLTHGNIVSIRFTSISYYETNMVITFKGTPDMLGKTLVASGLRVMLDGDDLVLALQ